MNSTQLAFWSSGIKEQALRPSLLVIDDDPFFRAQIRNFAESDYVVVEYDNPALIGEAELEHADVAVLDLNMPGVDGIEFLKTLSAITPRPRLVIASGCDSLIISMAKKTAELYGIEGTVALQKPITRQQLLDTLAGLHALEDKAPSLSLGIDTRKSDESEISVGMQAGEFIPYYQPQIELLTQKVIGIETLARWDHPELGILVPSTFIETLELSPLAVEFTFLIAEIAMRDYQHLRIHAGYDGTLSVNISPNIIALDSFSKRIIELADKYQIPPHKLVLEMTERGLESIGSSMISTLTRLKMRGIQLSLDDFGIGQSGLSKLKTRAFDEIKIDSSFIEDLTVSRESQMIVEGIIRLSSEANLRVVAEGIESSETMDWLSQAGCCVVQGFYFSKPLSVDKLAEWLINWNIKHKLVT